MAGRWIGAGVASSLLALGAAACGGEDERSEERAKTAVVEILSSNEAAVCGRVTDSFLEQSTGESGEEAKAACEATVTAGEPPGSIEVDEITVEGDAATGTATSSGNTVDFELLYEDEQWKLDTVTLREPADAGDSGEAGGPEETNGSGDSGE